MGIVLLFNLTKIKFKILRVTFFKSFLLLKNFWMDFAVDDLPHAQWDETEFSIVY